MKGFKVRWLWFKAMGHYRKSKYDMFFAIIKLLEASTSLSSYQLAIKANALLLSGQYKESLGIFSVLSCSSEKPTDNSQYISIYSKAMIADINGDTCEFERLSKLASEVPAKGIIKRSLPLIN